MVNKDPEFVNVSEFNYQIDSISPAIKAGLPIDDILYDLRGNPRPNPNPTALGAYEFVK
jgi:hypothetical protein